MHRRYNIPLALLLSALLAVVAVSRRAESASPEAPLPETVDFNRDIRPILSENCFFCHGPDANRRKAGLRLDVEEEALADREGRRAIMPGAPEQSEAWKRIVHADPEDRMPPEDSRKSLNDRQVALVKRWIEQGAKWKGHWAFIPPVKPPLPEVSNGTWASNPIDRFVLARMEEAGLQPSPEADRRSLIRRLAFDLTGLPPTLAEVDAFVSDRSPDAYERVVDHYLNSPAYGERLTLAWMDAARYGDSSVFHGDGPREMWAWRDWVIQAFNADMPFDRFTTEQIAGDLLPDATVYQKVASAFNRHHGTSDEGGAIDEEYRVMYVVDRVKTTAKVWLGLSMECAQCHDHKYDPITQKEYYGFFAFFNRTTDPGMQARSGNVVPLVYVPDAELEARIARLKAQAAEAADKIKSHEQAAEPGFQSWVVDATARAAAGEEVVKPEDPAAAILAIPADQRNDPQTQTLRTYYLGSVDPQHPELLREQAQLAAEIERLDKSRTCMVMEEQADPRKTFLLMRGDYASPDTREAIEPGVPHVFPALPPDAPRNRLGLAMWLTSTDHPLTARVAVNRYWAMLFGTGIVPTATDFGAQGAWPSHPELLDWLAVDFMENGWRTRRAIKQIVMSSTYRQSSRATAELLVKDPQNIWLARGPRARLQAEFIRDQALAVSGLLTTNVGGPGVHPYQPPGLWAEVSLDPNLRFEPDHGEKLYRKSMYIYWKRSAPHPGMLLFDAPTREDCVIQRPVTNTPLQALYTLNDDQFVEAARVLAQRMMREGGATPRERITFAHRLATAQAPSAKTLNTLTALYEHEAARFREEPSRAEQLLAVGESPRDPALDPAEHAAWTVVASVILNMDATLTKP